MPIIFQQPSSKTDVVLGTKCFAYSTLNALVLNGVVLPNITDQLQADTWIKAEKSFVSTGGGPAKVLKLLALNPNQVSIQFTDKFKFISLAINAVENQLPAILATTVGKSNHWIVFTGVSGNNILAEDQQNPSRGELSFVANESNVFTATVGRTIYTLNSINIFITNSAQRDVLDKL